MKKAKPADLNVKNSIFPQSLRDFPSNGHLLPKTSASPQYYTIELDIRAGAPLSSLFVLLVVLLLLYGLDTNLIDTKVISYCLILSRNCQWILFLLPTINFGNFLLCFHFKGCGSKTFFLQDLRLYKACSQLENNYKSSGISYKVLKDLNNSY